MNLGDGSGWTSFLETDRKQRHTIRFFLSCDKKKHFLFFLKLAIYEFFNILRETKRPHTQNQTTKNIFKTAKLQKFQT